MTITTLHATQENRLACPLEDKDMRVYNEAASTPLGHWHNEPNDNQE